MALSKASQTITLILALLLAFSVNTASAAAPFGIAKYEGYTEGVLGINGTIFGVEVEMYGTMEQIFEQFAKEHPEVELDFKNETAATSRATRGVDNKADLNCCPKDPFGWTGAAVKTIEDGIWYLQHVNALCTVGKRSCVRVSCSYRAGIYLCNDNYYDIASNCVYIASYAQDLINSCPSRLWNGKRWYDAVCGQEFDTDNYNVIVHYANEGC